MCLGIPGKIVEIVDEAEQLGLVDVGGIKRKVNLSCVAPVGTSLCQLVESWVLVHVGFAMSVIDEDEAAKTLDALRQLGEVQEELDRMCHSATP